MSQVFDNNAAVDDGGFNDPTLKSIHLDNGESVPVKTAASVLPNTSRSTLYRWAKYGVDNKMAEELLILYSEGRILPKTAPWKGWNFNHDGELCCERYTKRKGMSPYQLEQTLFLQNLFIDQCHVIEQIQEGLVVLNNRLAGIESLRLPEEMGHTDLKIKPN